LSSYINPSLNSYVHSDLRAVHYTTRIPLCSCELKGTEALPQPKVEKAWKLYKANAI